MATKANPAMEALRRNVTGAVERGEAEAVTEQRPATRRDWTTVGAAYSTEERRPQLERVISGLAWTEMPAGGKLNLPFMPGEGIKAAITQLRLPKVTALAWNGALRFSAPGEEGEYPGLYGVEANYSNARVRVYLIDHGTGIVPVCMDVWERRV